MLGWFMWRQEAIHKANGDRRDASEKAQDERSSKTQDSLDRLALSITLLIIEAKNIGEPVKQIANDIAERTRDAIKKRDVK